MSKRNWVFSLDTAGAAAALAWTALAWLSHGTPGPTPITFLSLLIVAWGAAVTAAVRGRETSISWTRILIWAAMFRLIAVFAVPVFEDDHHRYLWDGHVFAERGSPYGVIPLDHFDDATIPPELRPSLDGINHPDLPTIYGPLFQLLFLASYLIAPGSLTVLKLCLVVAELAMLLLLRRSLSPAAWLLLAWCPLLIFETGFNAHPDALGVLCLVGAVRLADRGRSTPRAFAAAGAMAAMAVAARIFAAPLIPFVLGFRGRGRGAAWLAFAAVLTGFYLPFALRGSLETRSLVAFAAGWEFNSSLFGLASLALGQSVARALAPVVALTLVAVCWWRRDRDSPWVAIAPAFAAILVCSPAVNPWYLLWMMPFVAWRPSAWGWAAAALVPLSYLHGLTMPSLGLEPYRHPVWLRPVEYGGVVAAALIERWARRRPPSA